MLVQAHVTLAKHDVATDDEIDITFTKTLDLDFLCADILVTDEAAGETFEFQIETLSVRAHKPATGLVSPHVSVMSYIIEWTEQLEATLRKMGWTDGKEENPV